MRRKLKKLHRFNRLYIVGLMIALQLFFIFAIILEFTEYFPIYYVLMTVLEIGFMLRIINSNQNMAYKLAWIVVILLFPAFGVAVYIIFCGNRISEVNRERMSSITTITESAADRNDDIQMALSEENRDAARQAEYIRKTALCPPYQQTETTYFASGEAMFEPLLRELEAAERYIFLEYFIIDYGTMWDKIHDILVRKVAAGVDVRLIYDDMGCISTLDKNFAAKLEAEGIRCRVFHKFVPVLSAHQNNRDHRKICVIDGVCAFTGGINLADEYINAVERFGYWKDTAVMLKGSAAWSFTVMFLTMWDYLTMQKRKPDECYSEYRPDPEKISRYSGAGFVQPYTDNPLDGEPVGENVYLGMIAAATDYVWIMTPYLIIDEAMEQALCYAAKSGVDVRILTPGVPDKKIVNENTKSYYPNLIANGVKIYEFSPGFLHAKTFLCDDCYATVGSVNLDYRSLYLHFECGVWMYKADCIPSIKHDFELTFRRSVQVTDEKRGLIRRLFRGVLELLAPLM
ncbi:MAG: cardiolipin synthase [Eubacteriales bacterium]